MSVVGKLCHHFTASSRVLVYKSGGVHLVYKARRGEETTVTFAWGSNAKDLDICTYWLDAQDNKVGYGWQYHTAGIYQEYPAKVDGVDYIIGYNGDYRDTNDSEWIKVRKTDWTKGSNVLRIHLNFHDYDAIQYPDTSVTVIAVQSGSQTLTANVTTNQRNGKAFATDPYVEVTFDTAGRLTGLTSSTS